MEKMKSFVSDHLDTANYIISTTVKKRSNYLKLEWPAIKQFFITLVPFHEKFAQVCRTKVDWQIWEWYPSLCISCATWHCPTFLTCKKVFLIRTLPSYCWIGAPSAAEVVIVSAKVFFLLLFPDWNNNRNNIKDKTFISWSEHCAF